MGGGEDTPPPTALQFNNITKERSHGIQKLYLIIGILKNNNKYTSEYNGPQNY